MANAERKVEAPTRAWCICVPARDEADRLGGFLDALAVQDIDQPIFVVVAINNTTDRSTDIVSEASRRHGSRLAIFVDEHNFPAENAHAGSARCRAMGLGASLLKHESTAVLISTDADTRPPVDWVRSNLNAIDFGADLVGGRLVIDEAEPLASDLAVARALWQNYWRRVRAIEDEIDPSGCDPAPRHGDHTGASLAITVDAYEAAGGVPPLATGEDRALVCAAVAAGRCLVHPLAVWTRVSPRLEGRAVGGMADDIKQLRADISAGRFQAAPALDHWRKRFTWRRELRQRLGAAAVYAVEASLPAMPHDMPLFRLLTTEDCP